MNVTVDLDVEVLHGHPVQVLAVLREHLAGLTLESLHDEVLACVQNVTKIEIS